MKIKTELTAHMKSMGLSYDKLEEQILRQRPYLKTYYKTRSISGKSRRCTESTLEMQKLWEKMSQKKNKNLVEEWAVALGLHPLELRRMGCTPLDSTEWLQQQIDQLRKDVFKLQKQLDFMKKSDR